MAQKPETVFRARVRKFLKKLSIIGPLYYEPIQQKAIVGSPDYVLCIGGLFAGLELKKDEASKPSKVQEAKLRDISRCGGMSLVACPENWEATALLLTNLVQEARLTMQGEENAGDGNSH